MRRTAKLIFILTFILTGIINFSEASDDKYVKLTLESSYEVEIPKTWKIIDEGKTIAMQNKTDSALNASNIKQNDGQNRIIFAANGYKENSSVATARLSVRPAKTFSQSDLRQMTQTDFDEMAKEMRAGIERQTLKIDGKIVSQKFISVNKKIIKGKIALSTEIEQVSSDGKKMRQITDLYFLGDRNVKMSVSYILTEAKLNKPIVDRIRNSFNIK